MDKYIQVTKTVFHLFKIQTLNPLSQVLDKIDRSSTARGKCTGLAGICRFSHTIRGNYTLQGKVQCKNINCQLDKAFRNTMLIKKFSEVTELLKKKLHNTIIQKQPLWTRRVDLHGYDWTFSTSTKIAQSLPWVFMWEKAEESKADTVTGQLATVTNQQKLLPPTHLLFKEHHSNACLRKCIYNLHVLQNT